MNASTPEPATRPQRRLLIALVGGAFAVVIVLLATQIWASRREALQEVAAKTHDYAAIIEARLDATLRRTDSVLQAVARELPAAAMARGAVSTHAREITDDLDRDLVNFAEVIGLRIFDADGEMLYSSSVPWSPRANIADRAHFRALRDDPRAGVLFSEVIDADASGRQVVVAARALRDAQSKFIGVVLAVIDLGHFQRLFQSLAIGPAGVLVIRRKDDYRGVVRWPPLQREINRPLPPGNPVREAMQAGQDAGTLAFPASSDGVLRTYSYRSVERYPFFVLVAAAHDDALSGWRSRSLAVGGSAALLVLLLAGLLSRLWRIEASESRSAAALVRLNAELESRVEQRTTELVAARDEAERANRAKSEFLSNMSHELRTPMNAILGFAQLLEAEAPQQLRTRQQRHVQEILRAGRHLLGLIDDLLDFARIEAGKVELDLEAVRVSTLLEDCLALVGPAARERSIELPATLPAACDCHVRADPMRLKQVLLNLLSNAIAYNRPHGQVRIDCQADGPAVRVSVTDTGAGLTDEQQRRLFQSFERLDADRTAVKGAGIGLVLSKRLVELMGAEIGMHSEVGVGSTFWVRLDRADAASAIASPEPPSPEATALAAPPAVTKLVLYIEDDPVNLMLMEAVFASRPGLQLVGAALPERGLQLARSERVDLILLDIQLPGIDGYEVLRRLRADESTRAIPVIAVSANAMPADIERGLAAGFLDYLTKPLDMPQLLQAVHQALDSVEG